MKTVIIDGEAAACYGMRNILADAIEVFEVSNPTGARRLPRNHRPDIVLLDLSLGGDGGFDSLEETQLCKSPTLVVISTAQGSERMALEEMEKGTYGSRARFKEEQAGASLSPREKDLFARWSFSEITHQIV